MARLFVSLSMVVVAALAVGWNYKLQQKPVDVSATVAATDSRSSPSVPSPDAELIVDLPTERPRLAQSVQTLARPIFNPDRRPFVAKQVEPEPVRVPAAVVVEPQPRVAPPDLVLLGISGSPSDSRALVRSGNEPPKWVVADETLGGWTVENVAAGEITLTSNGETIVYSLFPTVPADDPLVTPAGTQAPATQ